MSQYCPTLLHYFSVAQPSPATPAQAITAARTSPVCADHVRLSVSLRRNAVDAVTSTARGCVGVIGLTRLVQEHLVGLSIGELTAVNVAALIDEVEFVEPEHLHAFELVAEVIADIAAQCTVAEATHD